MSPAAHALLTDLHRAPCLVADVDLAALGALEDRGLVLVNQGRVHITQRGADLIEQEAA